MNSFSLKVKFWCALGRAAIVVEKSANRFSRYCLRKSLDVFETRPDATAELAKELGPWLERCQHGQS